MSSTLDTLLETESTDTDDGPEQPIAVLSTADKRGICNIAGRLHALGFEVRSSTGTYKEIAEFTDIPVKDMAEWTGIGASFDHRVVTISTRFAAGILTDRIEHAAEMAEKGFRYVDFVFFGLYPIQEMVEDKQEQGEPIAWEDILKKFDVGGPSALAGAAKGGRLVVTTPADALTVIERLEHGPEFSRDEVRRLGVRAVATAAHHWMRVAELMADDLGMVLNFEQDGVVIAGS